MKFDTVIIGGGLAGHTAASVLAERGLRIAIVSEGLSLRSFPAMNLPSSLCSVFPGDRVVSADVEDGRVKALYTVRLEDEPLEADNFILATGKYFSRGIVADMDKVCEPVFGLEVEADDDRSAWFSADFSSEQRFLSFGVKNYGKGRVAIDGVVLENLFAAGEVLSGITGIESNAEDIIKQSAADAAANIR